MFKKVFIVGLICLVQALFLTGCLSTQAERNFQAINEFMFKYTTAADQGDTSKQLELAKLYLTGQLPLSMQEEFGKEYQVYPPYTFSFNIDRNTAINWFEKAIRTKNVDALTMYGEFLINGYDKTKYAYGFELLQEAMALGSSRAKALVGVQYASGVNGIKQDIKKAQQIFAEVPNESYSKVGLANMYYYGYGFKKDVQKAINLATEAANEGQYHAMILLAVIYTEGNGVEKSPTLAMNWAQKAFIYAWSQGIVEPVATSYCAQNLLSNPGFDTQYGDFVKQALQSVLNQYGTSQEATMAYSFFALFALQNRLGLNYYEGVKYAQMAANLGDKSAQEFISNFKKDLKEIMAKAEKGDTQSEVFLMNYYYYVGDNLTPNPIKAIEYANKLAAKNNPQGLMALASMHMEGKYLPQNRQQVLDYIQRAANQGEPTAVKLMNQYYAQVRKQQALQIQQQQAMQQAQMQLIEEQRDYIRQKQWQESIDRFKPTFTNCSIYGNSASCTSF